MHGGALPARRCCRELDAAAGGVENALRTPRLAVCRLLLEARFGLFFEEFGASFSTNEKQCFRPVYRYKRWAALLNDALGLSR